jgi:hypothetical protein
MKPELKRFAAATLVVVNLLKLRFPNLTTAETIVLAQDIVDAVMDAYESVDK